MLDSIYHMTLRLLRNFNSAVKSYNVVIMYATLLWTSLRFPNICLLILLYGIISLPDGTSCDKVC